MELLVVILAFFIVVVMVIHISFLSADIKKAVIEINEKNEEQIDRLIEEMQEIVFTLREFK